MKLWRFPSPWDYHQQGAYVVAAETREAAIAALESESVRSEAEHAHWTQDKAAANDVIFGNEKPGRFDLDPGWGKWRTWLDEHPEPSVISLPTGYQELVEDVGLVYVDKGCDC